MGNNHAESIDAAPAAASIDRAADPVAPAGHPLRRTILLGAGVIGAAAAALAACGTGGSSTPTAVVTGPIAKTADIPVGGGKIFTSPPVVVVQPTAGTFKAFSSICTHAGCPVTQIANRTITCPCHGSQYSIVDGSVTRAAVQGQAGLHAEQISVTDGVISIV